MAEQERLELQEEAARDRAFRAAKKKADHDATTEWRRTMLKETREAERREREQVAREREELEIKALEDEHSQRQARRRALAEESDISRSRSAQGDKSAGNLTAEV